MNWSRRTLLSWMSAVLGSYWWGTAARAETLVDGPVADLREQLEAGLLVRRDIEFDYIRRIIVLVNQGTLPMELVKSTFQWARKKRPYPLPYFQRALKLRAAKRGIQVPLN